MKFRDIPQLTQFSGYAVHVGWDFLPAHVIRAVEDGGLNVDPDFQRGHVWTLEQKVRYVEYVLKGGQYGRDLWFNCPDWHMGGREDYVLVDGKQRLSAALGFLNNEFPIFEGNYRRDFEDKPNMLTTNFVWHVNQLKTRDDVLVWYCDLNRGGTPHTDEEIAKVHGLMGRPWEPTTAQERFAAAGMDRPIFITVRENEEKRAAEQKAYLASLPPQKPSKKAKRR